jgi:hypothetical protein
VENITNTNNINNYTDTIVLTETETGGVNVTNVDNIMMIQLQVMTNTATPSMEMGPTERKMM